MSLGHLGLSTLRSGRARCSVPVFEQLAHSLSPLGYTCGDEFSGIISCGLSVSPCSALRSKSSRILHDKISNGSQLRLHYDLCGHCLLFFHLHKNEPAVVPAPDTRRISHDRGLCFVQAVRAKGYPLRQTSQLVEKIVGIDVVSPRRCHRLSDLLGVEISEDLLNTTQFRDCVDLMFVQ